MAANRLGIFHMCDADGIVDRYITCLLDDLARNVQHLIIVCNGGVNEDSLYKLKKYTTDVYCRPNEGYSATSIKKTLGELFGWEKVYQYDELVFVDDSCFGPLYPLEIVFETMEQKEVDFWGLTEQNPLPPIPSHIQTYFFVVRNKLLHSYDFRHFWETLPQIASYDDSVVHYELRMTHFFAELGYICGAYVDSRQFVATNPEDNYAYIWHEPYRLIAQCNCPLVKRENFSAPLEDKLEVSSGEDMPKVITYIREHTTYDENMIWDHLLRTCNVSDLRDALHLDYIFSTRTRKAVSPIRPRTAVITHVYYPDLVEECFEYIKQVPAEIDLIITTSREDTRERIEEYLSKHHIPNGRVVMSRNRGREISGMLIECRNLLMQYEYLCFVHDKKTTGSAGVSKIGQSFMDLLWGNTLKSPEYISNVLDCFEENLRLGFLAPPAPHHAFYLGVSSESWTLNYPETMQLASRLGLNCRLSEDKHPFILGTAFWCRTKALKTLFEYDWEYEDFTKEPMPVDGTFSHAIERIFPYVAQHEGYYSGIMMSEEYAAIQSVNIRYMLNQLLKQIKKESGIPHYSYTFNKALEMAGGAHVRKFINQNKKVFIYGTGDIASRCAANLITEMINFEGFIVSDGRREWRQFFNRPVYELSEVELDSDTGIILALNPIYQREVLALLEGKGYKNIFRM